KKFTQTDVPRLLNQAPNLVFICGHYEGFDERQISIGDFITMGGEIPALAIADSLIRAIPGAIQSESYQQETFTNAQLDFATYTRPEIFEDLKVPSVLLSGKNRYQVGKGDTSKTPFDDLDSIAAKLEITKNTLLSNLKKHDVLIQMKKLKVNWAPLQGGYMQVTYQVLDTRTIASLREVVFEEGEYIAELGARYENLLGYVSNIEVKIHSTVTNKDRKISFATVPYSPLTSRYFTLRNIACLTGYGGGINCNGLGA
ncbi:7848_t:CDS:2, partial [Funneliformis geosporum]